MDDINLFDPGVSYIQIGERIMDFRRWGKIPVIRNEILKFQKHQSLISLVEYK
jgi:hypothetical protein